MLLAVSPLPLLAALFVLLPQGAGLWENLRETFRPQGSATPRANGVADPSGQAVTGLTLSPAAVAGGQTSDATVTLRRPAPAGGVSVQLSSGGAGAARVPRSVLVPEGRTSATFHVTTDRVSAASSATVSASLGSSARTDTLTLLPAPAGRAWYVAPEGTSKGRGTRQSPWDLSTALAGGAAGDEIKPGDTVWVRGGRYAGAFVSTLAGRPDAPVVVRAAAGERAVVDRAGVSESKQPALKVKGPHVWFWGLEVTNSHPDRARRSPYDNKDEPWRGSGADVYARGVKLVNMVFHDNGHGVWDKQDGTEISGCLFYYNGNNKREHALYVGNNAGTKLIADNILFSQGGYGILAHSNSTPGAQRGLHLEGNVAFNNGLLTADDQTTGNIQVGGVRGVPAERIHISNNYVYTSEGSAASKSNGIRLGYEDASNVDARLLDNYVVARAPFRVWWWRALEFQGNTVCSREETFELRLPEGANPAEYLWDFNTYFGASAGRPTFVRDSRAYDFARWRQATGFDAHSRFEQTRRPSGTKVFVRPNRYEAGRAHVVVFNWDGRERVEADLGGVLKPGAEFEVLDAQNYFGGAVLRGRFDGSPVSLPLNLKRVAPPVGNVERAPAHTAPEFAVFVVRQSAARAGGEGNRP
ncbi:MAG TPA: right-handed parallel beta-helix repeat-containing protein, partial [Pyrinomonadaceae bacterium]|nr:right-handed parallel beta-helix repeat-containing protein [Pyrinomonadaceae bacterium]